MQLGLVPIAGDRRRIHVHKSPFRVVGEQMPAADLAELAVASLRLVVDANSVLAPGDLHRLGFPEAECVDRRGRPAPARRAMTESSRDRLSGHSELDSAAKTGSLVSLVHRYPLVSARPNKRARLDI